MTRTSTRRLAVFGAAIAALTVGAGAVFADHQMPAAAGDGLARAAAAAGKTVPVRPAAPGVTADEQTPDAPESTPTTAAAPDATHGSVVSAAAKTPTPDGFANHGAYVSSIARQNHGQTTAAAAKAAHKPADTGKPTDAGKPAGVPSH